MLPSGSNFLFSLSFPVLLEVAFSSLELGGLERLPAEDLRVDDDCHDIVRVQFRVLRNPASRGTVEVGKVLGGVELAELDLVHRVEPHGEIGVVHVNGLGDHFVILGLGVAALLDYVHEELEHFEAGSSHELHEGLHFHGGGERQLPTWTLFRERGKDGKRSEELDLAACDSSGSRRG